MNLNQRSMKMCYLSLEPERQGHASYTHVHEIIDNLKLIGWVVSLYCPRYEDGKLPGALRRLLSITKTNLNAILSSRPDVYYMRWHFAAFPTALWAKIINVPTVIEINGPQDDLFIAWPFTRKFKRFFSWLMVSQLRWAAGIIGVTNGLSDMGREIAGQSNIIVTIPNGANTDQFSPSSKDDVNDFTKAWPERFIIFFGTMAPWQGIRSVLEAVQDQNWPKDLHVVFAGDGSERGAVEDVANRISHAHYIGRVPYTILPGILARALGSFVCTENLEGRGDTGLAPLKMFESLACGVPVIATDMPFQADLVRNSDCGIIVDQGNSTMMVKAASELAENEDSRRAKGERGRDVVLQDHSWWARAQQTHELLAQVLKKAK